MHKQLEFPWIAEMDKEYRDRILLERINEVCNISRAVIKKQRERYEKFKNME